MQRHHNRGPKYAYFDELTSYLDRGQSLVVYHHHNFGAPAKDQVWKRLSQVNERLGESFALRYLRGSPRSFFVVPSEAHRGVLSERAKRLTCGVWSEHFKLFAPDGV